MKLGHLAVRGAGLVVHAWGSEKGLVAVRLGEVPRGADRAGASPIEGIEIVEGAPSLSGLERALATYLAGGPLEWEGPLDTRGATEFQCEVFVEVRGVLYGERTTYGEIARRIGRPQAVRAVGNALHRNPFPLVVPCHRVIREGGKLGGYSCGPALKERLLSLEAGQIELGWEVAGEADDGDRSVPG